MARMHTQLSVCRPFSIHFNFAGFVFAIFISFVVSSYMDNVCLSLILDMFILCISSGLPYSGS